MSTVHQLSISMELDHTLQFFIKILKRDAKHGQRTLGRLSEKAVWGGFYDTSLIEQVGDEIIS